MLAKFAKEHAKITEWAESFETGATKEDVLSEVSEKGLMKTRRKQSLSETCSSRKRMARDVLFQHPGHQGPLSKFSE